MDSMDNVRERFEALEQQTEQLQQHTHLVEQRLRGSRSPWHGAAVAVLGLALALPHLAQAKTFQCGAGDVQCLIDAINEANANGEKNRIRLEAGTYTLTAVDNADSFGNANGLPVITSTLTITGHGAETTIIERDANAPHFRILAVAAAGTLTLKRLTLRGGGAPSSPPPLLGGGIRNSGILTLINCILTGHAAFIGGGGLANDPGGLVTIAHTTIAQNLGSPGSFGAGGLHNNSGTVTITHSTIIGNSADNGGGLTNEPGGTVILTHTTVTENTAGGGGGGGIRNSGQLEITNSTVSHNSSSNFGGGLLADTGTTVILNATIADNTIRNGSGGGIDARSGSVILQNTILARNTLGPLPSDCGGPVTFFTSLGTNLIGDPTGCTITLQRTDLTGDPGLDTFTDNGRPGNGHFPLLPTSPAIDAGSDAVCPRTDQLGQRRIGPCDIGAIRFLDEDDRQHEEEDDQQHDADPAAATQIAQ